MKALLRPAFVLGLSIAIAATSLLGSSSVALAASPSITAWSLSGPVYEGDRPSVIATFADADLTDLHTVDIAWGDDTYDFYTLPVGQRSFSLQKTVAYANDQSSLLIQITLNDPTSSNTKFLGVNVLNAAPSFTSFGLSATDLEAGGAVTATGAFTDGGANDTHTVTLDWGDGSPVTTTSLGAALSFTTEAHTYAEARDFIVTATVRDNAGATAVATSTVSVHIPNQAPSIVSFGVTAGNEGGESTLALAFADADALDTHTVSVSWGDSSPSDPPVELAAGVTTFEATHVYTDNGNYSVVMTLGDSAGHTVTADASVSPTNVGPVVGSLELSPSSVVDRQLLTVSGSFTDPGTADTFTLTLDWGDGTSSTQSLGTARSFSAAHAYGAAGPVTITATVEDRDHATDSSSADLVVLPSNHAPADLLDEMSWLVRSFDLDRNTERWLLKKIGDLKGSLTYGNSHVCSTTATLSHIMFFAHRTLESEQYAALSALGAELEAAAGCTNNASQPPKDQRAATVRTTTLTPAPPQTPASTQKKDTTTEATKSAKSDSKRAEGRSPH